MSRWWRAYDEAVDDPKLQRLPPSLFKSWFNLMCLASLNGGKLPAIGDVAFKLRVPKLKAELIVSALVSAGLLDEKNGAIEPHNWRGRQYESDRDPTAAQRSQRYRDKQRVTRDATYASRTSHAVQSTETEYRDRGQSTETEKKKDIKSKRGSRLPENWELSSEDRKFAADEGLGLFETDQQAAKFKDYWLARAGAPGIKLDWKATWRNWVRKVCEDRGIAKPAAVVEFKPPPGAPSREELMRRYGNGTE